MPKDVQTASEPADRVRAAFRAALAGFDASRPTVVLGHFDADGLSALAIFVRALRAAGREAQARIVGKGESVWGGGLAAELAALEPGGLIVCDLGLREGEPAPGVPTVVVDHHVPQGNAGGATVIGGCDFRPIPTSSLLAFWCAAELTDPEPLLWLAALGIIGDMAEDAGFPELDEARKRYGKTALKDAVSLINAPRRTASADAGPSLALLLKGEGPKDVIGGRYPETELLKAAKAEVAAELETARRVAPKVRDGVALIRFSSPTQIHPLIAQQWRGRLKGEIVLAANTGYRPGWVHFAARSARDVDLIAWLAERRPEGADDHYGSGHRAATGGALRIPQWNAFVESLGFPEERL